MDGEQRLRAALKDAAEPAGRAVPFEPIEVGARRRRRTKALTALTATGVLATAGVVVAVLVTSPSGTPVAEAPTHSTKTPSCASTRLRHLSSASSGEYLLIGSRVYEAVPAVLLGEHIGAQIGSAYCSLSTTMPPQGGNIASNLPSGTRIYEVRGYPMSFRIAVPAGRAYRLFELVSAPYATKGGDLLPLTGKVRRIEIVRGSKTIGSIENLVTVERLMSTIAGSPVVTGTRGPSLFVRFVLTDGTSVRLIPWYPNQALLDRIRLPRDVNDILREAARP